MHQFLLWRNVFPLHPFASNTTMDRPRIGILEESQGTGSAHQPSRRPERAARPVVRAGTGSTRPCPLLHRPPGSAHVVRGPCTHHQYSLRPINASQGNLRLALQRKRCLYPRNAATGRRKSPLSLSLSLLQSASLRQMYRELEHKITVGNRKGRTQSH